MLDGRGGLERVCGGFDVADLGAGLRRDGRGYMGGESGGEAHGARDRIKELCWRAEAGCGTRERRSNLPQMSRVLKLEWTR